MKVMPIVFNSNQKNEKVNFRGLEEFKVFEELISPAKVKHFFKSSKHSPETGSVNAFFSSVYEKQC